MIIRDWRAYCNIYQKANATLSALLKPSIRCRKKDEMFDYPNVLWEAIQTDLQQVIKLDG
jgi:hypothetical protein